MEHPQGWRKQFKGGSGSRANAGLRIGQAPKYAATRGVWEHTSQEIFEF